MKKLKVRRETIVNLTTSELENVQGGNHTIVIVIRTRMCPPPPTHGCTGGPCVETIGTGTSVINPG
jgi:hypothetical protein